MNTAKRNTIVCLNQSLEGNVFQLILLEPSMTLKSLGYVRISKYMYSSCNTGMQECFSDMYA